MLKMASMSYAHQEEDTQDIGFSPFGYEFAGSANQPPSAPPPLLQGPPMLSAHEQAQHKAFLQGFEGGPSSSRRVTDQLFDFEAIPLPTLAGYSSGYGHPAMQFSNAPMTFSGNMMPTGTNNLGAFGNPMMAGSTVGISPRALQTSTEQQLGSYQNSIQGRGSTSAASNLPTDPFNSFYQGAYPPVQQQPTVGIQSKRRPQGHQYGSDVSFASQQFVAPPQTGVTQDPERILECLELVNGVSSTPVVNAASRKRSRPEEEDQIEYPTTSKRRASSPGAKEERNQPNPRQLRRESHTSETKEDTAVMAKRPKVKKTTSKKVNLTEDQKKRNHIESEKKRRGNISKSLQDLETAAPKSVADLSKSSRYVFLGGANDWLEGMERMNETLRGYLATSQGGQP